MPLAFTILIGGLGARTEDYLVPILEGQGYIVRTAAGFPALLDTLSRSLDLVILDLPSDTELADLVTVRAACPCSLIVIGPSRDDRLLVAALELGADDYLQRPFRTDELLARIRAQLRRRERSQGHTLTFGPLTIDLPGRQATHAGLALTLTPEEFALLTTLASRPGFACPARLLIEQVWGNGRRGETQLLTGAVDRLRAMFEPDPHAPRILGGSLSQGYWLGDLTRERELNGE